MTSMLKLTFCQNIDSDCSEVFFFQKGENLLKSIQEKGYEVSSIKKSLLSQLIQLSPSILTLSNILEEVPIGIALHLSFKKSHLHEFKAHPLSMGHRTRSLELINFRLGIHRFNFNKSTLQLEELIKNLISKKQKISVMEIGIGHGRVLLELKNKFPNLSLHGLNKESGEFGFNGSSSLKETNNFFEINKSWNTHDYNTINISFGDLSSGKIENYADSSMDLIFSYATIRYIKFKHLIIEEIWGLLSLGGIAVLDIDLMFLNKKENNNSLADFLNNIDGLRYSKNHKVLTINKTNNNPLSLNLIFDESQSVYEDWDNLTPNKSSVGWSSVYKIKNGGA